MGNGFNHNDILFNKYTQNMSRVQGFLKIVKTAKQTFLFMTNFHVHPYGMVLVIHTERKIILTLNL